MSNVAFRARSATTSAAGGKRASWREPGELARPFGGPAAAWTPVPTNLLSRAGNFCSLLTPRATDYSGHSFVQQSRFPHPAVLGRIHHIGHRQTTLPDFHKGCNPTKQLHLVGGTPYNADEMVKRAEDNETAFSQLTGKQQRFVLAYLQCFNASQAAREAGYAARSARQIGHENLNKPEVAAAIAEELDARGLTAEHIKVALGEIAFGANPAAFNDFLTGAKTLAQLEKDGLNTMLAKSISVSETAKGSTRKVELLDRLAALRELARVLGIVTEKQEITGGLGVGLDLRDMPDAELKRLQHAIGSDITDGAPAPTPSAVGRRKA